MGHFLVTSSMSFKVLKFSLVRFFTPLKFVPTLFYSFCLALVTIPGLAFTSSLLMYIRIADFLYVDFSKIYLFLDNFTPLYNAL